MKSQFLPEMKFRLDGPSEKHTWWHQNILVEISRETLYFARKAMMEQRERLVKQLRDPNSGLDEEQKSWLANSTIWELEQHIEDIEELLGTVPGCDEIPDERSSVIYKVGEKVLVRKQGTMGDPPVGTEGVVYRLRDCDEIRIIGLRRYPKPVAVSFPIPEGGKVGENDFTNFDPRDRGRVVYWFQPENLIHTTGE